MIKVRYEREREQFEEFQQFSKELEAEMELELNQRERKISELETLKGRMASELATIKVVRAFFIYHILIY